MEEVLSSITEELENMLARAKELEAKYMGQIMALQKIFNLGQKTMPQIKKKQTVKPEEKKQQISKQYVDHQVDDILNGIQMRQKALQNDPKPKFEIKPPEPVVQKKPPIPTANRNEKAIKNFTPAYIPPKSKNEVTGKVTQTTIRANNQKVFKPELTGMKRAGSKDIINKGNSIVKGRSSVQVKPERKNQLPPAATVKPVQVKKEVIQDRKPTFTHEQKQKSQFVGKIMTQQQQHMSQNFKLTTFQKSVEQLYEQLSSKDNKIKRQILEKKIKQLQHEELGYKKQEQTSRIAFIKHACNYSISRNQVRPVISAKISRHRWNYSPQIFELGHIIQGLQGQVQNLLNIKEYRIDPKQEYRIVKTALKLQELLNDIEQAKSNVPDQLNLTFNFTSPEVKSTSLNTQDDLHSLNQANLNQEFMNLLQTISEREQLEKEQLKGLRTLAQIGVFRSKKTPIIVAQKQYQHWKSHYFTPFQ